MTRRYNSNLCPQGHELSPDNVVDKPTTRNGKTWIARVCRTCRDERLAAPPAIMVHQIHPRPHCAKGHPLVGDNLVELGGGKRWRRACRRCQRRWSRAEYLRKRLRHGLKIYLTQAEIIGNENT